MAADSKIEWTDHTSRRRMDCFVAGLAQGHAVGEFQAQLGMRGKRFDVVCMQVPAAIVSAVLASEPVAKHHVVAPALVVIGQALAESLHTSTVYIARSVSAAGGALSRGGTDLRARLHRVPLASAVLGRAFAAALILARLSSDIVFPFIGGTNVAFLFNHALRTISLRVRGSAMAETTNIEWCDATFNPWIGCTKVSPACDHCYAERSTPSRTLGVTWGAGQKRLRTSPGNWNLPLRWNAHADTFMAMHGRRQRVFCASLADVFDNEVPDTWRADLFDLIDATPNLDWLLLTKRIGNVPDMMRRILRPGALPPHVWMGATICNQPEADRDITKLLAVQARVRFLSMEPLLGRVDLNLTRQRIQAQRSQLARAINGETWLDWIIVGGESGPDARPMQVAWAQALQQQCAAAGVPFFMKQMGGARDKRGALDDLPDGLQVREFPCETN